VHTSFPRNTQRLLRLRFLLPNVLRSKTFTTAAKIRATSSVESMMPSSKHGVKSKDRTWKQICYPNNISTLLSRCIQWTRVAIPQRPCNWPSQSITHNEHEKLCRSTRRWKEGRLTKIQFGIQMSRLIGPIGTIFIYINKYTTTFDLLHFCKSFCL
jgi:hypothetical protein